MRERDLEDRVRKLECQLDEYHERLECALDHDRRFQLKATWGIVSTMCAASALFGTLWLAGKLGLDGWILGLIVGFGSIFAMGAASIWADRGREEDVKKLSRLPKWEDRSRY